MTSRPPVVLFGYDSSTFTAKVRLVLRMKQIPYTFVAVNSMMPRPVLRDNFNLTYRKIPVLAIGRDVRIYCDSSIIIEALEHIFSDGHPSMYPPAADGRTYRTLIRGFASYWTDRPLFRVACGLMPGSVWRTSFGTDRAGLIGHKLDADKLEAKIPENLFNYDMHCSMFESHLQEADGRWLFSTERPSLADASLYYELEWANDVAAGRIVEGLTGGRLGNTENQGSASVFNDRRHPALCRWFEKMKAHIDGLPLTEKRAEREEEGISLIEGWPLGSEARLLPTVNAAHGELAEKSGLLVGARVSIAPDDTGRADPTVGTLVALSPEETVLEPAVVGAGARVKVYVHFPRLGFVVRPVKESRL